MRTQFAWRSWLAALVVAGFTVSCGSDEPAAPPTTDDGAAVDMATTEPVDTGMDYTCDDPLGCVEVADGAPVRIAAMFVLSGSDESLGRDSLNGVEIAVDDMGMIHGHSIEVAAEDDGCSAEGGQTAATKVAADDTIAGVVGTSCSSAAEAAIPIVTSAGLTMISPSNTAPRLTAPTRDASYAGYLRTAHNDRFQGRVAAEFAYNELGLRSAATIHDGSPYAEELQAVFAAVFQELGGTITSQQAINKGETDMRPVLSTIAADSPEIIFLPIFVAEGGFVVAQAREVDGLASTVLMGADGLFSADFVTAAGAAAEGMYLTGPYVEGGDYQGFLDKHQAKYGTVPPSAFHAHAYDATLILLRAISSVAQTGADGTLYIPRQAVRDAVYATANFAGLTGSLTCQGEGSDNPGDCATGEALAVFQIDATVAADPAGNWPPPVFWRP